MYVPFLSIGGFVIHLPYLFTFACSLVFFLFVFWYNALPRIYFTFALLYWMGGIWIYAVGWLNQGVDKSILLGYFMGTLSIFAVYPVVRIFSRKIGVDNVNFIIWAVYISGLIHAMIMILAFFVAPFREILYSVVPLGDKGSGFVESMVRSPGLTTGGGDALSIVQSISLMFGIYYFVEIKKRFTIFRSLFFLLSFLILLLSILLSARTGLILFFLFIAGMLLYRFVKFILNQKIDLSLASKALFILTIFAIIIPIGYTYLMESEYRRFANRAFELYIN